MKLYLIAGIAALATVPALAQVAPASTQAPQILPAPVPAPQILRAPVPAKVHSRAEVQARVAEHFARLDSNRDGFLTRQEADAGRAAMGQRIRERVAERRADPARRGAAFDRIDTNRDGSISRQEFDAHHAQRGHAMAARGQGKAMRAHAGTAHGPRGGIGALHGRMFELADANRDGRVSLAEAQAAAMRHFDTADLDRNGVVTREERMQRRQQIRTERSRG